MAAESSSRTEQRVVWTTRKLNENESVESPYFSVINLKWKLEMKYSSDKIIEIALKNCDDVKSFPPFQVRTFLEDRRTNTRLHCSTSSMSSIYEVLYQEKIEFIERILPGLKLYDDITISCLFNITTDELKLGQQPESDTSIQKWRRVVWIPERPEWQASTERPVFSLISQKRKLCDKKDAENDSSVKQSTSADSSPAIQNLRKDPVLDSSFMPDIVLKSGDVVIPAHTKILAARSRVFAKKFELEKQESRCKIIELEDVEPSLLHIFLRYMYSGKMPDDFSEEMIYELYTLGDKYAVPALQKSCSNCMSSYLNNENFTKILLLADEHKDQELKERVTEYIIKLPELMTKDMWISFSKKYPSLANEICLKHTEKTTLEK